MAPTGWGDASAAVAAAATAAPAEALTDVAVAGDGGGVVEQEEPPDGEPGLLTSRMGPTHVWQGSDADAGEL